MQAIHTSYAFERCSVVVVQCESSNEGLRHCDDGILFHQGFHLKEICHQLIRKECVLTIQLPFGLARDAAPEVCYRGPVQNLAQRTE